jgi:excisionase family DNA binding protein
VIHEWLTVEEAARHAKCGVRSIYLAVRQGKLRAARLGGRRELRLLAAWVDEWLLATSTPVPVRPLIHVEDVVDSAPAQPHDPARAAS